LDPTREKIGVLGVGRQKAEEVWPDTAKPCTVHCKRSRVRVEQVTLEHHCRIIYSVILSSWTANTSKAKQIKNEHSNVKIKNAGILLVTRFTYFHWFPIIIISNYHIHTPSLLLVASFSNVSSVTSLLFIRRTYALF
jgi:hypothetical protein